MNIFLKIAKKYGSQKKAAAALGVSTSIYSDWVLNNKRPTPKNINKIAKIERIRPGELFEQIYPKGE